MSHSSDKPARQAGPEAAAPPAGQEETGRYLVYFAAERTLMSWIRSALGLMALGFVMDRFSLVLREMLLQAGGKAPYGTFPAWAGAAVVLLGALMALVAIVRYWRFERRYDRGNDDAGHGLRPAILFTAIIAAAGFVIALFLLSVGR
jgi:putative membrane protein